jgi:hypothetical protein
MDQNSSDKIMFRQNNYQIIENFIEEDFVDFIQDYYSLKVNSGLHTIDESKFTYGYFFHNDSLMETILQNSCEAISDIIDVKLLPTYSQVHLHMNGDSYENNQNESSEISAILSLGNSGDSEDYVYFKKTQSNVKELSLNKGDLLVYRNINFKCWREPIKNKWLLESVLNFVDSEGHYSEFIYDKRPYLGFNK